MSAQIPIPQINENFVARHPAITYFALTFAVSWLGAFAVAAPHFLRGEGIPKFAGLMTFPAMLLGPCAVGILLTWFIDGTPGPRDLFSRMRRIRVPARWYAALLIPPVLVLTVFFLMKTFVSPVFAPNRFFAGMGFGFVAGFFEEIGWMGFAFPKEERDWLIGGSPEKFMHPSASDMRYHWVLARMAALEPDEMRELVIDAWRMVVPKQVAASYVEGRPSA